MTLKIVGALLFLSILLTLALIRFFQKKRGLQKKLAMDCAGILVFNVRSRLVTQDPKMRKQVEADSFPEPVWQIGGAYWWGSDRMVLQFIFNPTTVSEEESKNLIRIINDVVNHESRKIFHDIPESRKLLIRTEFAFNESLAEKITEGGQGNVGV